MHGSTAQLAAIPSFSSAHQMVLAKASSMLRRRRSVTWRPADMKASPLIAIMTVANCSTAGGRGESRQGGGMVSTSETNKRRG